MLPTAPSSRRRTPGPRPHQRCSRAGQHRTVAVKDSRIHILNKTLEPPRRRETKGCVCMVPSRNSGPPSASNASGFSRSDRVADSPACTRQFVTVINLRQHKLHRLLAQTAPVPRTVDVSASASIPYAARTLCTCPSERGGTAFLGSSGVLYSAHRNAGGDQYAAVPYSHSSTNERHVVSGRAWLSYKLRTGEEMKHNDVDMQGARDIRLHPTVQL